MKDQKKLSIQEEIEREAEEIKEELSRHPELDDVEVSEEADAALLEKICAFEKEKEEEKTVRTVHYRKKRKKRLLLVLAAVLVLALGVGMTSAGSKSYLKVLFDRIVGDESVQVINVEDMEEQETEDVDEDAVYKEISEKLGIISVRFVNKPEGMQLITYSIDNAVNKASVIYKYNEEIIRYMIYVNDNDSSWGNKEVDEKIDEYFLMVGDVTVQLEEYQVPDYQLHRMVANFEYQGVQYQLKGVMDKEKFEDIIKNLHFV